MSAKVDYDSSESATDLTVVYTLAGADMANYIAPVDFTNYIIKRSIGADNSKIILDLITKSKVYDGTTTVAIILGPRDGIIDGDELIISASAFYDADSDVSILIILLIIMRMVMLVIVKIIIIIIMIFFMKMMMIKMWEQTSRLKLGSSYREVKQLIIFYRTTK